MNGVWRCLLRLVALCGLLLGTASVNAAFSMGEQYSIANYVQQVGWHSTRGAACHTLLDFETAKYPSFTVVIVEPMNAYCTIRRSNQYGTSDTNNAYVTSLACPANSTQSGQECTCDAGYLEQGGSCVPDTNECTAKAGTSGIVNWTTGWTRTPNDNDFNWIGGPPKYPDVGSSACSNGCSVEVDGSAVQDAWLSQVPTAQGLYRNSVDYMARYTGDKCTMSDDNPLDPSAPNLECPGYVGDVNGVPGCYGTAQKPVNPSKVPRLDDPKAGNPAAGAKPETGEGSGTGSQGRTPITGDGGNAGGPAGAGVGGKGGGAGGAAGTGGGTGGGTGTGEEPKPCGGPGQPKCNVKVDETGTPTSNSRSGEYETEIGKFQTEQKNRIDGASGAAAQAVGDWGFSFALPTGCGPLDMGGYGFQIDVCQWQGMIHDLMSMVWLAVAAWTCIGMIGRTISGGA